jgi:hypothetical protein
MATPYAVRLYPKPAAFLQNKAAGNFSGRAVMKLADAALIIQHLSGLRGCANQIITLIKVGRGNDGAHLTAELLW